jgi:hypothetical protein
MLARSETAVLRSVLAILTDLPAWRLGAPDASRVQGAIIQLRRLHDQAAMGLHKNPAVVLYGNPPAGFEPGTAYGDRGAASWMVRSLGVLSRDVHDIRYTHAKDGQPYEHEFTTPTELLVVERKVRGVPRTDVLVTSRDGLPIVEDF